MVLQRGRPIPVWGMGTPGDTVTATFGDDRAETRIAADGDWELTLPARPASFQPATLVLATAKQRVEIRDVLVGEVWLCSGQSNMEWSVAAAKDADLERLAARHPAIRLYHLEREAARTPRFGNPAVWKVCSPETIGSFSAVANAGWEPARYDERLRVQIEDWREWFRQKEMPFGIAQLANFLEPKQTPSDDPWPRLREAQRDLAASDPSIGLVVAIDLGEADDIHPRTKQEVGRRFARWALADVYGLLDLRGGPELRRARFGNEAVELEFEQVGDGLKALDGPPLEGFTLAGPDGEFHPAEARIREDGTAVVRSEAVPRPVHLRYGWQNNPARANLGNQARLPATPFEAKKD